MPSTDSIMSADLAIMPQPKPDADFAAFYYDLSESLSAPVEPLDQVACVVQWGHDAGVLPDAAVADITGTRRGVAAACQQADAVLNALLLQARQQSDALLAEAGLNLPPVAAVDLDVQLASDYSGKGACLSLYHDNAVFGFDISLFLASDAPDCLKDLALQMATLLAHCGLIGSMAPFLIEESEMIATSFINQADCAFIELYEAWCLGGMLPDSADDAVAQFLAESPEYIDDTASCNEVREAWQNITSALRNPWPILDNPDNYTPDGVAEAVSRACAQGFSHHPVVTYAQAAVQLVRRFALLPQLDIGPHLEMFDAHMMVTVITREVEYEAINELHTMYMSGEELPALYVSDMTALPWATVRDLMAAWMTQLRAFDVFNAAGLLGAEQVCVLNAA